LRHASRSARPAQLRFLIEERSKRGREVLTQRLFRSAASRVVISLAGIVVSFLLTPFIIGHLGSDGYGLWLLVSAITAIYAVMDLGLSVATQRAVAQALATGCTDVANEFVNTAFVSFCGVSAVILLATVVELVGYIRAARSQ